MIYRRYGAFGPFAANWAVGLARFSRSAPFAAMRFRLIDVDLV